MQTLAPPVMHKMKPLEPIQTSASKIAPITPKPFTPPSTGRTVRGTLGADGAVTSLPPQETYKSTMAGYLDDPRRQGPSVEDQAQIRQQMLDAQQAQIDSVNKFYAEQRQEEQIAGMGRLGQTRALSARGGVLGSDFGAAAKGKTTEYNVQEQEMIEAKRNATVQSILTGVQNRADAMIEARRTESREDFDKYVGTMKALREEARTSMTQLANTGISLDELSEDQYNNLLQQTEYHPFILEHLYNDSLPEEQKKEYKFTSTSRGVVASTVDPLTGKPEVEFFDYPGVEEGDEVHFSDGVPYITSTDEDGNKTVKIATGFEAPRDEKKIDSFTDAEGNRVEVFFDEKTGKTRRVSQGQVESKTGGDKGGTMFTTPDGVDIDMATVEGLKSLKVLGMDSYSELDAFMSENTSLSDTTRKNLLLEAGFSTPTAGGTVENKVLPALADQILDQIKSDAKKEDTLLKWEPSIRKKKLEKLIKQIKSGLFSPKVGGKPVKLTPEQRDQLIKLLEE